MIFIRYESLQNKKSSKKDKKVVDKLRKIW